MIIDLEALAYILYTVIDFESDDETANPWSCALRGVSIKGHPEDDRSISALATGHTREAAAENLVHILRGRWVSDRVHTDKYCQVPSALIVGEIGKEQ